MPFSQDAGGQWQWNGSDSDWLGAPAATLTAPSVLDDTMRKLQLDNLQDQAKAVDNYTQGQPYPQGAGLASATASATPALSPAPLSPTGTATARYAAPDYTNDPNLSAEQQAAIKSGEGYPSGGAQVQKAVATDTAANAPVPVLSPQQIQQLAYQREHPELQPTFETAMLQGLAMPGMQGLTPLRAIGGLATAAIAGNEANQAFPNAPTIPILGNTAGLVAGIPAFSLGAGLTGGLDNVIRGAGERPPVAAAMNPEFRDFSTRELQQRFKDANDAYWDLYYKNPNDPYLAEMDKNIGTLGAEIKGRLPDSKFNYGQINSMVSPEEQAAFLRSRGINPEDANVMAAGAPGIDYGAGAPPISQQERGINPAPAASPEPPVPPPAVTAPAASEAAAANVAPPAGAAPPFSNRNEVPFTQGNATPPNVPGLRDAEQFGVTQAWAARMPNVPPAEATPLQIATGLYNAGLETTVEGIRSDPVLAAAGIRTPADLYEYANRTGIRLPQEQPPSGQVEAHEPQLAPYGPEGSPYASRGRADLDPRWQYSPQTGWEWKGNPTDAGQPYTPVSPPENPPVAPSSAPENPPVAPRVGGLGEQVSAQIPELNRVLTNDEATAYLNGKGLPKDAVGPATPPVAAASSTPPPVPPSAAPPSPPVSPAGSPLGATPPGAPGYIPPPTGTVPPMGTPPGRGAPGAGVGGGRGPIVGGLAPAGAGGGAGGGAAGAPPVGPYAMPGGGPRPSFPTRPATITDKVINELVGAIRAVQSLETLGPHQLRMATGLELSHPTNIPQTESAYMRVLTAKDPPAIREAINARINSQPFVGGSGAGIPGLRSTYNQITDFNRAAAGPQPRLGTPVAQQIVNKVSLGIVPRASEATFTRLEAVRKLAYNDEAAKLFKQGITDQKWYDDIYAKTAHAGGQAFSKGSPSQVAGGFFYSPSAILARFATAADLVFGTGAPFPWAAGGRAIAMKALMMDAASDATVLGLSRVLGANVTLPTAGNVVTHYIDKTDNSDSESISTKLLKASSGRTSAEASTGYLSQVRGFANLVNDYQNGDRDSFNQHATGMVRNELGAVPSLAANMIAGTDYRNQPYGTKQLLSANTGKELFGPFFANEMWDALKTPGGSAPLALWGLGGASVNTSPVSAAFEDRMNKQGLSGKELTDIQTQLQPYFNGGAQLRAQGGSQQDATLWQAQYLRDNPEIRDALQKGGYALPSGPLSSPSRSFSAQPLTTPSRSFQPANNGGLTSPSREFQYTPKATPTFTPRNKQPVAAGAP